MAKTAGDGAQGVGSHGGPSKQALSAQTVVGASMSAPAAARKASMVRNIKQNHLCLRADASIYAGTHCTRQRAQRPTLLQHLWPARMPPFRLHSSRVLVPQIHREGTQHCEPVKPM